MLMMMKNLASRSTTCGGSSIGHQLTISIVLLSIALLSPGHALPRPTVGAVPTQLFYNELLNSGPANEDNLFYGEQLVSLKQQQQQRQQHKQLPSFNSFVNKWPSLRDLLLTADYEDDVLLPTNNNNNNNLEESNERAQLGSRLVARLHRLSESGDGDDQLRYNVIDDMAAMPAKKQSENVKLGIQAKQHNIKKNVQYMSPCHFKICNMGRKRNAGSFVPY
ncbi:uncharacterized protein LOC133844830 isoform X1 [Drosophila sulfurigaster albostrigata]|uniref:uncharacterized protein LOC133844830 isoform X1 n=1 Tax=Drosophila sulfurigaster albostrigata TaxID=89887 RepID=UPI002D21914D|nr:uncharacterized protein LOC133844830 isoform X1 [Drosophila sulfurigaster albostrigata]